MFYLISTFAHMLICVAYTLFGITVEVKVS